MGRIAMAALVIVAACRYGDPDFGDVPFMCDADHPCPSSAFVCAGLRCVLPPAPASDGVECATMTCLWPLKCCVDFDGTGSCEPMEEYCSSWYEAVCDEIADCPAGTACCDEPGGPTCRPDCVTRVCRPDTEDADCLADAPACVVPFDGLTPWGTCQYDSF